MSDQALKEQRDHGHTDSDAQFGSASSNRLGRSFRIGSAVGGQAGKFLRTKAANLARSSEKAQEKLEDRHLESALKMCSVLGEMKGAAMKIGQMASFIDTEFLPEEYRELYQEQLASLTASAPAMPWKKVRQVLVEEYEGKEPEEVFAEIEHDAFAAASIGQVHRATLQDGTKVAVKIQYPDIARALEADMANVGTLVKLSKVIAPGIDTKEVAAELKERFHEELDYELEAQNQRVFARAFAGHPFIFIPRVHTKLSRRRVLVTDYVDGMGFEEVKKLPQDEKDLFGEIIFRFAFSSLHRLRHFNADTHPGNCLLMRDGRVAFLDFGMTKRVSSEQVELEQAMIDAAFRSDSERLLSTLAELGFVKNPTDVDAEHLLDHARCVAGWYIDDCELSVTPEHVSKMVEVLSDPRNEHFKMHRRETVPADELMGRRMESGLMGMLAQLRAKANWHQIVREWIYGDEPTTVLGIADRKFLDAVAG